MQNYSLQQKCLDRIQELFDVAKENNLNVPDDVEYDFHVKFDLKSVRTAGMAVFDRYGMYIRLHLKALEVYEEDYIRQTVAHEVAHILQFCNCPNSKSHGREFKYFMRMFGVSTKRTCSYNLRQFNQNNKVEYVFKCSCQEHILTKNRYTRWKRGTGYVCRQCNQDIQFVEKR